MPSEISKAVQDGEGLREAFTSCVEENGRPICEAQLLTALIVSEAAAQENYDVSAELMPNHARKFTEIKGEEKVHWRELGAISKTLLMNR
ncbi:Uncharacterised protein [uncultured archaeon]|nr:Uncharacterised protein [uncultured archaeon]